MRAFLRAFREENTIIGNDADRHAVNTGKAGDERRAVKRLEFIKARTIHQTGDHLANVILLLEISRNDSLKLGRIEQRFVRLGKRDVDGLRAVEIADNATSRFKRVMIIKRVVIGDAREPGMNISPAQILGADHLARRGLHQWRTAQKDRALPAHNHSLVGHGRHIGPACRAGAHHHRDLRNAGSGEVRLIVEDAAEMFAIREDIRLVREVGAARIDEIDARQPVLQRDLLRAQMLLHGHRIIGAALDGGIIADNHHLAAGDPPDACDHAGGVDIPLIHAEGGKRAHLEKGRAGIEKAHHPRPRQQFATRRVPLTRLGIAAKRSLGAARLQLVAQPRPVSCIGAHIRRREIYL